jgi:hypothetical protein
LVGWLSGVRAQTDSVAKATFLSRLGEAAASEEGSAGRAPTLHRLPWHLSYNREKSRKPSVRLAEKCSADQRRTRFENAGNTQVSSYIGNAVGGDWLSEKLVLANRVS